MDAAVSARKMTLHQLFGRGAGTQVRVPDYQRGYSWEKQHFEAFLLDLVKFSESRKEAEVYFLGPIVMMRGHTADEHIFLVDGQQRVATSIILLATIRDLARSLPEFVREGK